MEPMSSGQLRGHEVAVGMLPVSDNLDAPSIDLQRSQ